MFLFNLLTWGNMQLPQIVQCFWNSHHIISMERKAIGTKEIISNAWASGNLKLLQNRFSVLTHMPILFYVEFNE